MWGDVAVDTAELTAVAAKLTECADQMAGVGSVVLSLAGYVRPTDSGESIGPAVTEFGRQWAVLLRDLTSAVQDVAATLVTAAALYESSDGYLLEPAG